MLINSSKKPNYIRETKLRKGGQVLRWLMLACLMPALAGATSRVIDAASDLPYTTVGPYDTVRVTVNGIISTVAGTSITLAHDHCRLLLNGNTLYVCQGSVNGFNRGVIVHGDSCGISNGTLEQHSSSTNDSCRIVEVGANVRNLTMLNVNIHSRGYGSGGFYAPGASEVRVVGGNYTSYVTDFDSREYQWTAPILLLDEVEGARTAPQQFRYWVSHVVIDSCPHIGICINGGTLWCDSNYVRVDARNHWTYPSGDIFRCTANAYGLALDRIGANCRVIGNTVRSGKNHRGGRGMAFDGQASYLTNRSIEIAYNDDSTHAGPDANYGHGYQSVGVRIRDTGTDSVYFHHNKIVVVADTSIATEHTGSKAIGVWLTNNGVNWRFENNEIRAVGIPGLYAQRNSFYTIGSDGQCGSMARAVAFDALTISDRVIWRYNRIESNVVPISFGEINTNTIAGENIYFYQDTINRITPDFADEWGNDGAIIMSLYGGDCEDNYLTDAYFVADSTVGWDGAGPGELTVRRAFKITVLGNDGVPFEGARVRVRNVYGQNTVLGTTGLDGTVDDFEAAVKYLHTGIGNDSTYSPFVISAIYGADSVVMTEANVGLRTNLNDTLRLINNGGTGELDTIPPSAVGDLSAAPAAVTGHMTFGWTSTGDDGTVGVANFDSIRYSTAPINEGNWAVATVYPRTAAPLASGTHDQVDIAEATPVNGQFYYVGIKAYDNLHNPSPLAVTSGFARGILRPQISTDTTLVNQETQQVTFYANVVPSYLEHYYEFQLDSDVSFPSPTTVNDNDPGTYAEATFPLPGENETVLIRCRAVALNQSETSPWSPTRAFSVSGGYVNGPPSTPVAYSPVADDIVTSLRPALVITNSSDPDLDALSYEFAVLNDAGVTTLATSGLIAQASPRTTWTVPAGVLQDTTDYTWRARSFDGEAYSAWMTLVPFSVYVLSTGDDPEAVMVHAYPNPVRFGSGELVTFVLPDEPVDLTILTVSGSVVLFRTGVSGEWQWDGSNQSGSLVAPGVYPWFLSDNRGHGKLVVKP